MCNLASDSVLIENYPSQKLIIECSSLFLVIIQELFVSYSLISSYFLDVLLTCCPRVLYYKVLPDAEL